MELRPILTTLRRHKTASALIVLEIALSCAIICNALFLISGRIDRLGRISGLAENELVRVQLTGIGKDDNDVALTTSDLATLRSLPGVRDAIVFCAPLHLFRARWIFRRIYGTHGVRARFRLAPVVPTPGALAWELGAVTVMARQVRAAQSELEGA